MIDLLGSHGLVIASTNVALITYDKEADAIRIEHTPPLLAQSDEAVHGVWF